MCRRFDPVHRHHFNMSNLSSFPTHEKEVGTLLSIGFTPMNIKVTETKKEPRLIPFCIFEQSGRLMTYRIYTQADFDVLSSLLNTIKVDDTSIKRNDVKITSVNGVNIKVQVRAERGGWVDFQVNAHNAWWANTQVNTSTPLITEVNYPAAPVLVSSEISERDLSQRLMTLAEPDAQGEAPF